MKTRSKVKLSLIADKTSRRATFKKRKGGIMKKLNELVTLCDVKACAIVYSPYDSNVEAWPSREGAQEVFSRFMELPMLQRTKKVVDQKAYLLEKIRKEQEQVKKLQNENRQFEIRELMFDCLKGKMMESHFHDESDIGDLRSFIDHYANELSRRIEVLQVNGESNFYDQNQHRFYDMDSNHFMNHNMSQSSNQYPNQQQLFMEQLMAHPRHEMGHVEENASIPPMDENHYRHQQLPTTGHVPSITTTSTTDNTINNNSWPTRIGFE